MTELTEEQKVIVGLVERQVLAADMAKDKLIKSEKGSGDIWHTATLLAYWRTKKMREEILKVIDVKLDEYRKTLRL